MRNYYCKDNNNKLVVSVSLTIKYHVCVCALWIILPNSDGQFPNDFHTIMANINSTEMCAPYIVPLCQLAFINRDVCPEFKIEHIGGHMRAPASPACQTLLITNTHTHSHITHTLKWMRCSTISNIFSACSEPKRLYQNFALVAGCQTIGWPPNCFAMCRDKVFGMCVKLT